MANDFRQRNNNIAGTLSSTLTNVATTMVSAGLQQLQAITSTQHAAIILDPGRANGAPEIVWVTAHTAASSKATVVRGKEGTAARTHPTPLETWIHGPTQQDYTQIVSSTALPALGNVFKGMAVYDNKNAVVRVNTAGTTAITGYKQVTMAPPTVRVKRLASQTLLANTWTAIAFSSKEWDTNTMFATTGTKVTCKTAGKFLATFNLTFQGSTRNGLYLNYIGIRKNSTGTAGPDEAIQGLVNFNTAGNANSGSVSAVIGLTTGQFIEGVAFSGGSSNGLKTSTGRAKPTLTMTWLSS